MSMSFTVQLNDPSHLPQDAALVADLRAAAADWSRFINALGSIDIELDVAPTIRASAAPGVTVFVGTDGSRNVFEAGAAREMRTGVDPNGSSPDIIIKVDPSYLQNELWLDPDPAHPSAIPANKVDGISVFRHEIAHGFGITGYRDQNTGSLPSDHESVWDKLVKLNPDGSASFVGPSAAAFYGGNVPVTTLSNGEQYFHLGNGSDAASRDLMNGVAFFGGTSYAISELDVAILRDLGLPLTPELHRLANTGIDPHPVGWLPTSAGDFNHDGTNDLLWYNSNNRDVDLWKISNGQWAGSVAIGAHPAGYTLSTTGDFNGDGTADVLWFNPGNGDVDIWKISNAQWAGSVSPGSHPLGWQVAGSGDFNADGTADVLWFDPTNNRVDIWKISNGQWAGSVDVGPHPAGWQPIGTGDFNHDGTSDVLWYNPATRDIDLWKLSNGQWAGSVDIGTHPAGWAPAGAGDFNHDGTSDLLWFNASTGGAEVWLISNGHWMASSDLGVHPAGWAPAGVGDFNHDGFADVLWREAATNRVEMWMMTYS